MYSASIDLTKIGELVRAAHSAAQKGQNGKQYFNLVLWINDEADQFGNHISIQANSKKEKKEAEGKQYVGNGKRIGGDAAPVTATGSSVVIDMSDDLPF
jgi:hypothetical protein